MTISKEQIDRIKNQVAKDNYDICHGQTEWEMVDVEVREALYDEVLRRYIERYQIKQENRPAYPTNARMHTEMTGITKREFFIAHAPKVVPKWFKPVMPERPKMEVPLHTIFGKYSDHKHKDLFLQCWCDESEMFDEEVPEELRLEVEHHIEKSNKAYEKVCAWDRDLVIETDIQWPIFWADNMLKKIHVEH
jgi:hypothetical protein